MPDNWAFVLGAYGLAAVVFAGYWRHLVRREREVEALGGARSHRQATGDRVADRAPARGGRP